MKKVIDEVIYATVSIIPVRAGHVGNENLNPFQAVHRLQEGRPPVRAEDLILCGLRRVGKGSWVPVLNVRL